MFLELFFLAHLAKARVGCCQHLASVIGSSISASMRCVLSNLLLRNSLDLLLPVLYLVEYLLNGAEEALEILH